MLPKSKRLTKEDFTGLRPKVFFRGELVDISYTPSSSIKFACVISKKTLKRAVDRNQVKRRCMESIQGIQPTRTSFFVLYPKKSCITSTYQQIHDEITKAFATLR